MPDRKAGHNNSDETAFTVRNTVFVSTQVTTLEVSDQTQQYKTLQ